jgi:hypothetical protein
MKPISHKVLNSVFDQGEEEHDLIVKGGAGTTVWMDIGNLLLYIVLVDSNQVMVEYWKPGDDVMGIPRQRDVFKLKGANDGL